VLLGALLAGGIMGGTDGGRLWGDDRVAVRTRSEADYVAWKFGSGSPKDETYLFAQGQYFSGAVRDRSLTRMTFRQLATTLAGGLAKQHYYPTRDLQKADLLIVVHWGMTTVADNSYKQLAQTSIRADDPDRLRRGMAQSLGVAMVADTAYIGDEQARVNDNVFQELDQLASVMTMTSNAQLLGFTEELRHDARSAFGTNEGEMIRALLSDERYFVIVMAYDYQTLLKEKKHKLLWSARLSMRSPGMNFREGIIDMSVVGGMYFGHQTDGVKVKMPADRDVKVDIGPLRILGMDDP